MSGDVYTWQCVWCREYITRTDDIITIPAYLNRRAQAHYHRACYRTALVAQRLGVFK